MQYFVTGATGFIGKRLVKTLLARKGAVVHFLLRRESEGKVADLLAYWGTTKARAVPVFGDLTAKKLGVAAEDLKALKGQVDAVFHLAAVYDLKADEETQVRGNIEGTRNVVEFAKAVEAKHLHHVSSIAAARPMPELPPVTSTTLPATVPLSERSMNRSGSRWRSQ
jgi:thioester reductase-like protein